MDCSTTAAVYQQIRPYLSNMNMMLDNVTQNLGKIREHMAGVNKFPHATFFFSEDHIYWSRVFSTRGINVDRSNLNERTKTKLQSFVDVVSKTYGNAGSPEDRVSFPAKEDQFDLSGRLLPYIIHIFQDKYSDGYLNLKNASWSIMEEQDLRAEYA